MAKSVRECSVFGIDDGSILLAGNTSADWNRACANRSGSRWGADWVRGGFGGRFNANFGRRDPSAEDDCS